MSAARKVAKPDSGLIERWMAFCDAGTKVASPADVMPILLGHLIAEDGGMLDHERLVIVAINRAGTVIDSAVLTTGNDGATLVCPRQIFRWALTRSRPVSNVIMAHNHPSGDPSPSPSDVEAMDKVASVGRILGVKLSDSIIIGAGGSYRSMADMGLLREGGRR